MKCYSRVLTLVALLNALLGTTLAAEPLDELLQAEIDSLAAKLTDGVAYLGAAPEAHWGEEKTPLANHVVVLFVLTSWAGGNGSRQFMAVMEHNDEPIEFPNGRRFRPYRLVGVVQVGRDFDRAFKTVELRQDRVILGGHRWLKGDAHCCPSGETRAVYRVTERGVNEVPR